MFDIDTLILNKADSKYHNLHEIDFIVQSYTNNQISNAKMSSWLEVVYRNGMSLDETIQYTKSIINSGEQIIFDDLDGYIVDKHSTGGVGDKVSMILGPILAACGCFVPMIAGRSLGHTGGTLDKLESIPGYNGLLSSKRFKNIVKNVGISIIGQTHEICPADKKIYKLRDNTNTIASFPLICGSIMSKKIAEGISGLVLDIKTGNGAFMETIKEADRLGKYLTKIGSKFNLDVGYITSNMNQPLGNYAGLQCEIIECIEALNGNGQKDLMDVVFCLGDIALSMANIINRKNKMKDVIKNGLAYEIFCKMVHEHGGSLKNISMNCSTNIEVVAEKSGYLQYTNTKKLGEAVNYLTITNNKSIDLNAGINFCKKNGDYLEKNETIALIFSNSKTRGEIAYSMVKGSLAIQQKKTDNHSFKIL